MWLMIFSVIYFTALCAAQVSDSYASEVHPMTTLLPMSSVTPALSLDPPAGQIYKGERARLHCSAQGSPPGWTYLWFRNDHEAAPLQPSDPTSTSYTIDSATLADTGTYWCRIKRGEDLSMISNSISLAVIDLPKPSVKQQTQWLDVFPSEKVELSCEVQGSSDWTFTWHRDGQQINADSAVSLAPDGSILTITPGSQIYSGKYVCRGHHKAKSVTTGDSDSLTLQVHANKPKPTITQTSGVDKMFVGEPASFTCRVDVSSGWEYLWYKDGVEVQTADNYIMKSSSPSDSGQYWCRAKRGKTPFTTEKSETKTLQVLDLPKPSLKQKTQWLDVFPSEKVELSCEVQGSSDWTFTWHRDGQQINADSAVSLAPEGSILTITPGSQIYSGNYVCRGHHKARSVTTGYSDSLTLQVHANKPKPTITQTSGVDKMFVGEPASFTCRVDVSSGWEYLWYKGGVEVQTADNYTMKSPSLSDNGQYWCRAKRGKTPFTTETSETKTLLFSNLPKPSLKQKTQWLDVFPSEKVELSCEVQGSSDWTFTWNRDRQQINADSAVSLDVEGSSLTILEATQSHAGVYDCKSDHKHRKISTGFSNTVDITVYGNKPKPTLRKDLGFEKIYVGESVSISCTVNVSSGWEYLWYKDGSQLSTSDTSRTTYTISSPAPSDGGIYTCKAKRGEEEFFTEDSETLTLNIIDIPVPFLELQTPWHHVFPSEKVDLRCGVNTSSDWNYTWYRNGRELDVETNLSIGADGSSLIMTSARHQDTGRYTCSGIHKNRPVKTEHSNFLHLTVNAKKPKPLMTQVPNVEKLYVGEEVVFGCGVDVSSGWEYLWYKNETRLLIDGNSFSIPSATSSDSSTYKCKAKRGKTIFNTEYSEVRTLHVSEIPVPSLQRKTPWLDVFPTESVKLHCEVKSSSEWNYRWFRGGRELPADSSMSGGILSIHSASVTDSGEYKCRGRHKSRSVSTKSSSGLTLKVYDEKPIPVLMQNPAYKEMYVGELLSFSCEVNVSSGWEYLWYIDRTQHPNSGSTYAITSAVTKDAAAYKCKAKRGQEKEFHTDFSETLNLDIQERPRAVMTLLTGWSDVFSRNSLVLRCEVQGSQHLWNYTWLRGGQELPLAHSSEHTVTPKDDPNQSQYSCKGIRTGRPSYSTTSDPFKTKNLLLKRRVLLSISGCLFFGIVAVFLGCVVLRVTRKPAELEAKTEEPNLFLTMAELKARDDAPCPFVECISEETLAALPKDGEDNGTVCSETTPLPISSLEDQAVTSETLDSATNGLMSFK